MSNLKHTPTSVQVKRTEEQVLETLRNCRAKGRTFFETAVDTTALFYELSDDLRQENIRLGTALQEALTEIKALKSLGNQRPLL